MPNNTLASVPSLDQAKKLWKLLDHGLVCGLGEAEPGRMCVEAAVCYALGLPHSDEPPCVMPGLRRFKISLNDQSWSSRFARANGLRELAVAQLGSLSLDPVEFATRLAEQTIRTILPIALRSTANQFSRESGPLRDVANRCERLGTRDSALIAAGVAKYAADRAEVKNNFSFLAYVANLAADAGMSAAHARSSDATPYNAAAVAGATAAIVDRETVPEVSRDMVLSRAAALAVGVLRTMNAPGIVLLDKLLADQTV